MPCRPTGASPMPTASISPGARCSSASTSGDAALKSRHDRGRTSARVMIATGASPCSAGLTRSIAVGTSTPRHRPCPPRLRSRTCQVSSARHQRRTTGDEARNTSRSNSSSHTANNARRFRSAPGPVLEPAPVPSRRQNRSPGVVASAGRSRPRRATCRAANAPDSRTRWNDAIEPITGHAGS